MPQHFAIGPAPSLCPRPVKATTPRLWGSKRSPLTPQRYRQMLPNASPWQGGQGRADVSEQPPATLVTAARLKPPSADNSHPKPQLHGSQPPCSHCSHSKPQHPNCRKKSAARKMAHGLPGAESSHSKPHLQNPLKTPTTTTRLPQPIAGICAELPATTPDPAPPPAAARRHSCSITHSPALCPEGGAQQRGPLHPPHPLTTPPAA